MSKFCNGLPGSISQSAPYPNLHAAIGGKRCMMCGKKRRKITKKCYFVPVVGGKAPFLTWCLTHLLHKQYHRLPSDA